MEEIALTPLETSYELINWDGPVKYPGLVRIRTPIDGSCFFHAIANSFFIPYRKGAISGVPMNQYRIIKELRKDLANKLSERVAPDTDITHYDLLGKGTLKSIAESIPEFSLEHMKQILDSDSSVSNIYNEFISNEINKDIYILNQDGDVYMTADNYSLLHKNRDSIVILYIPGHYELIGVYENEKIYTLFKPDHPLIIKIRERMNFWCSD